MSSLSGHLPSRPGPAPKAVSGTAMTPPATLLLARSAAKPPQLLRHSVGAVLRAQRKWLGSTLEPVCESAGVSVSYMSEVERGKKEPSSEMLNAMCRALDLDLPELLR